MKEPRRGVTFLQQQFEARQYPSAIEIGGQMIAGPFCLHCGNPATMHGPSSRCPSQHLHPLFPSPNLSYADEAGISRDARTLLRELRSKRSSVIAASLDGALLGELLAAGYVEKRGPWVEPA